MATRKTKPDIPKKLLIATVLSFSIAGNVVFSAETDLGDSAEELSGSTDNLVSAADTNQLIYEELDCEGARACSDSELTLFRTIEKLLHTAFGGRSDLSTGPDGLRASLYWFNTEESGSQGELASDSKTSQIGSIQSRLSALRAISNVSNLSVASGPGEVSGGAAANDELVSKWGIFANYGSMTGEKKQTDFSDELDFDGSNISIGVDYRVNNNWVLGLAGGYDKVDSSLQRTDFDVDDAIKPNVADGKTNLASTTLSAYALYQENQYYVSGIVAQSTLDYELERLIAYQSNNANVSGANDLAVASPAGSQTSIGLNAGVTFNQGSLSQTLDLGYSTSSTSIDAYSETGARILNFAVDKQEIDSSLVSLEGKISKVINTESSVLIPFVRARVIKQLDDKQYAITARYDAFESVNKFTVLTDVPDTSFAVIGVGISAVLRNGIQAYATYSSLQGYENLTASIINVGARVEF